MNVRTCLLIVALMAAMTPTPGTAQSSPATIAHAILSLEEGAGASVPQSQYAFLDAVIGEVRARVPAVPSDGATALAALKIVDQVLIQRNVIYPGQGLTEHLYEGLTERPLSPQAFQQAMGNSHNYRRVSAMLANKNGLFRVLDCDTASFVYLAVADALGWQLSLVEVPQHNFVRWTFANGTHLNFETMDGVERTDTDYIAAYAVPPSTIKPGFFLSAMSRDEVMGYVYGLRSSVFAGHGDFDKAKLDLAKARSLRPASPAPLNGEAWIYATCTPAACRDPAIAVADATKAVSLYRIANYLDTLACALVIAGDQQKAIEIETEAISKDPGSADLAANLKAIKAGEPCLYELPKPKFQSAPLLNRRMGNGAL